MKTAVADFLYFYVFGNCLPLRINKPCLSFPTHIFDDPIKGLNIISEECFLIEKIVLHFLLFPEVFWC
jgi:hypothetical protein